MATLVVVESPAKCKTIAKYLGPGFRVMASYGHVRDLLSKKGAVEPDNEFAQHYVPIERNIKHVQAIQDALKKSDTFVLAMDPDREGEAIAFHLVTMMQEAGLLKGKTIQRVAFNEITKGAVRDAIANPREISMSLVHAQQARRVLDYLVGFTLSPQLWRKVRPGLSAGRVQSPALIMLADREKEIEAFVAVEYWGIHATLESEKQEFPAKLVLYDGKKLKAHDIGNKEQADVMLATLKKAFKKTLTVFEVTEKNRKRNPSAPFTTSTLQQEASKRLGFTAQRTMRTAQQLYEGVDVGQGAVGLITYMRTDSVNLSETALTEIRAYIGKAFGADYVPDAPVVYKTKSKNAQEAHEAIRPAVVDVTPEAVKSALTPDQFKLYELIWRRAVACQMIPAQLLTVQVHLGTEDEHVFRALGSVVKEPGFMRVYEEEAEEGAAGEEMAAKWLPPLKKGQEVDLKSLLGTQHFTEPPPRYTEASLVKTLEEHGIGRPSTYATIISTLQQRGYAELEKKRFKPTDVGRIVAHFLDTYFTAYVSRDFTAGLEDDLDAISRDEKSWLEVMKSFWYPFKEQVDKISDTVKRSDVTQEQIDEKCPTCGDALAIRLGRNGRFIGCNSYPTCKYTRPIGDTPDDGTEAPAVDKACPTCSAPLLLRFGKFGKFYGCSKYPECKYIEPLTKPDETSVLCPICKSHNLVKRKSRYGKFFFACSGYPECKYAIWNEPVEQPCPQCHWPITTHKVTKRKGDERVCPQKGCGFAEPLVVEPTKE
ncbi:MAG: type I DNA topoisomerase [Pseudomonadota bacterium]